MSCIFDRDLETGLIIQKITTEVHVTSCSRIFAEDVSPRGVRLMISEFVRISSVICDCDSDWRRE